MMILGFEFRASHLLERHATDLATPPSLEKYNKFFIMGYNLTYKFIIKSFASQR
jgi:hypothetical protein